MAIPRTVSYEVRRIADHRNRAHWEIEPGYPAPSSVLSYLVRPYAWSKSFVEIEELMALFREISVATDRRSCTFLRSGHSLALFRAFWLFGEVHDLYNQNNRVQTTVVPLHLHEA